MLCTCHKVFMMVSESQLERRKQMEGHPHFAPSFYCKIKKCSSVLFLVLMLFLPNFGDSQSVQCFLYFRPHCTVLSWMEVVWRNRLRVIFPVSLHVYIEGDRLILDQLEFLHIYSIIITIIMINLSLNRCFISFKTPMNMCKENSINPFSGWGNKYSERLRDFLRLIRY